MSTEGAPPVWVACISVSRNRARATRTKIIVSAPSQPNRNARARRAVFRGISVSERRKETLAPGRSLLQEPGQVPIQEGSHHGHELAPPRLQCGSHLWLRRGHFATSFSYSSHCAARAAENLPPRVAGQSANSCRKGYPPGFRGMLTRPKEVKVARLGSQASPPYVARPWSSSSKAAPPEWVAKSGSCMATGDGLAPSGRAVGSPETRPARFRQPESELRDSVSNSHPPPNVYVMQLLVESGNSWHPNAALQGSAGEDTRCAHHPAPC